MRIKRKASTHLYALHSFFNFAFRLRPFWRLEGYFFRTLPHDHGHSSSFLEIDYVAC